MRKAQPDINGMATIGNRTAYVMVWNYHDNEETSVPDAAVKLNVAGLPKGGKKLMLRYYRIDQDHSNAYTVWKDMGSPQNPSDEQIARLKAAGQLQSIDSPRWVESKDGAVDLNFSLPRQAAWLVELSW